jgi:hypothetical protein
VGLDQVPGGFYSSPVSEQDPGNQRINCLAAGKIPVSQRRNKVWVDNMRLTGYSLIMKAEARLFKSLADETREETSHDME